MLFGPLLLSLFLAPTSTLALPNTASDAPQTNISKTTESITATDHFANDLFSWQAKGGCRIDWNHKEKCFKQGSSEGPTRCGKFTRLTSQIQGGVFVLVADVWLFVSF
jgi:hypothetical protein